LERKGNAPEVSSYSEVDDADDDEPRHIVPVEDLEFRNFENRQFLDVLFQRIPAQHKLVLTMYYLQELSYDEIGAVTGWPLGTVKATLHRAKANLRIQALAELGQ
jgi:RNA polymerase sigma-70 factor (ECF subfamily)